MNDTFYLIQDIVLGQVPSLVWGIIWFVALLGLATRYLKQMSDIKSI